MNPEINNYKEVNKILVNFDSCKKLRVSTTVQRIYWKLCKLDELVHFGQP